MATEKKISLTISYLNCYYDQSFTSCFFGASHKITWKNEHAVYRLQIPALVPEIFKGAMSRGFCCFRSILC